MDENLELMIDKAVDILRQGGIVLAPTDTVWGLMCDCTNEQAVSSIYNIKKSPHKPIAVLIDSLDRVEMLSIELSSHIRAIADSCWPGPLTLIFNSQNKDISHIAGENNSIGIRIPDSDELRELIKRFSKPLAATSANISGQSQPQSFDDITDEIAMNADYICQFNIKPSGVASTVVDCTSEVFKIIREGMISKERLEKAVHGQ